MTDLPNGMIAVQAGEDTDTYLVKLKTEGGTEVGFLGRIKRKRTSVGNRFDAIGPFCNTANHKTKTDALQTLLLLSTMED